MKMLKDDDDNEDDGVGGGCIYERKKRGGGGTFCSCPPFQIPRTTSTKTKKTKTKQVEGRIYSRRDYLMLSNAAAMRPGVVSVIVVIETEKVAFISTPPNSTFATYRLIASPSPLYGVLYTSHRSRTAGRRRRIASNSLLNGLLHDAHLNHSPSSHTSS